MTKTRDSNGRPDLRRNLRRLWEKEDADGNIDGQRSVRFRLKSSPRESVVLLLPISEWHGCGRKHPSGLDILW